MIHKNQYFNKLFKVDTINGLLNLDNELIEGTITRELKADHERTLKFIRYGFEEGIKFIESQIKAKEMESTRA